MWKFLVKNQSIEIVEREILADHQISYVQFKFTFDGDWKRFHKVAQFSQCDEVFNVVLGVDGTTLYLPSELHAGAAKMAVFGYDTESSTTVRATTVPVTLNIRASGFEGDDPPIPPTPDLYAQLLKRIEGAEHRIDGKSAYEIALDHGFVGTEEQWLASLHGADGHDGADGADGHDGRDGMDGKDGVDGADGAPGHDGVDGKNGKDGAPGRDGKSAYEIAVEQGFSGTEAEWLDSMKGDFTPYATKDLLYEQILLVREVIAPLEHAMHTHQNMDTLDNLAQTLADIQAQIDALKTNSYTTVFEYGTNALSRYADSIGIVLDGGYHTLQHFANQYPNFCCAANTYALYYGQEDFNWDKPILTCYEKPLHLTSASKVQICYNSAFSEPGEMYLINPPGGKIDVPIATYAMHEIEHGSAIQLQFEWLQSQNFITTETSCEGISHGEYYLAWIGRSDNTHPKIKSVRVLEG